MDHTTLRKWLRPHIGIKRWLLVALLGLVMVAVGIAFVLLKLIDFSDWWLTPLAVDERNIAFLIVVGAGAALFALQRLFHNILAPYRRTQQGDLVDMMESHNRLGRGLKVVAIGGGTGLPATLRGMKQYTSNITAVVTVADDGGSSGRLRRDMGVPPPGDLRNNIAALADDDTLLTRLFQYRFQEGDLKGHSFGNLFIAALADIVQQAGSERNSLAVALVEVERILNIRGRVLPATLDDVNLAALIRLHGSNRMVRVLGESQFETVDGMIDQLELIPADAQGYISSVQAILNADVIVIGPGSLYTSILPNLLVHDIADALRATNAYKIYVCNVATQPVETAGYTVADHVMAMEKHIGRGVFQAVIANDIYPVQNAGKNTRYVKKAPQQHEIAQRYEIYYADLVDVERPWRHDPHKLARAILQVCNHGANAKPIILSAS